MDPQVVWRANVESTRPLSTGIGWYKQQVEAFSREHLLYKKLYNYLISQKVDDLVWHNKFRRSNNINHRVFWRSGIHPPIPSPDLSLLDIQAIKAKRAVARILGYFVREPAHYKFADWRITAN
jgi:hypothetical protein